EKDKKFLLWHSTGARQKVSEYKKKEYESCIARTNSALRASSSAIKQAKNM
ncbi:33629_t:CDS:1, partial [Gigaspora margarita]